MRFASFVLLLIAACGSDSPVAAPGGNGPIDISGSVPPPTNPGAGGEGGAGGSGGAGGESGSGGRAGACNNDDDLDSLRFVAGGRDVARSCSIFQCSGLVDDGRRYEACITECVRRGTPGLSDACASCYGEAERCSLDRLCAPRCRINACALGCTSCLEEEGCLEALALCTGPIPAECAL